MFLFFLLSLSLSPSLPFLSHIEIWNLASIEMVCLKKQQQQKQLKFKVQSCSSESLIIHQLKAVANSDSHLQSGTHAENVKYYTVQSLAPVNEV